MAHLLVTGSGLRTAAVGGRTPYSKLPSFVLGVPSTCYLSREALLVWPERLQMSKALGGPVDNSTAGTLYFAQGKVTIGGLPVSRLVRIRRRDTGAVLVQGYSGGNGYFHYKWAGYAGPIEATIYDEGAISVDYNCKILDMLTPVS